MLRRPSVRIPIALFALAVAVRAIVLPLRRPALRRFDSSLSRIRSLRHVPALSRCAGAVHLHPGLRGRILASRWAARHRPAWTEAGAARLFLVITVASVGLNAAAFTAMSMPSWNTDRDDRVAADQALDAAGAPATDLLLSADPGGFKYFTGRGGVVTPNDSLEVIREIAADYDIRWLVLERAHLVAPMFPVIESKARPAWIGAPIFTVPYNGPPTGDAAADSAPAMAIYPVCTRLDDVRCGSTP